MKKKEPIKADKKILSFFLLAFPVVVIIAMAMVSPDVWYAMIALAIYQFIMLKQFLDNYYEVL